MHEKAVVIREDHDSYLGREVSFCHNCITHRLGLLETDALNRIDRLTLNGCTEVNSLVQIILDMYEHSGSVAIRRIVSNESEANIPMSYLFRKDGKMSLLTRWVLL